MSLAFRKIAGFLLLFRFAEINFVYFDTNSVHCAQHQLPRSLHIMTAVKIERCVLILSVHWKIEFLLENIKIAEVVWNQSNGNYLYTIRLRRLKTKLNFVVESKKWNFECEPIKKPIFLMVHCAWNCIFLSVCVLSSCENSFFGNWKIQIKTSNPQRKFQVNVYLIEKCIHLRCWIIEQEEQHTKEKESQLNSKKCVCRRFKIKKKIKIKTEIKSDDLST